MKFHYYNEITKLVKAVLKMKTHYKEQEIVADRFLKLPIVQKYEVCKKMSDGFIANIELDDGYEFALIVYVMQEAYPAQVIEKIRNISNDKGKYPVIAAPYISDVTAGICEKNKIGYVDYAGNAFFCGHSIYLSEKGNKNVNPNRRGLVSVFERSAEISSLILREIFYDVSKTWKLKYLSERVGCSIGQVSKVKDFLCRNAWAEMTSDGMKLLKPEEILAEWSRVYGKKESDLYACYSLDKPADIEKKLALMKEQSDIDYYLTGFSGGVRYAPVVRYNKVHVYISEEDIKEALAFLECRQVSDGQNLIIYPITNQCCLKDAHLENGFSVVSPVQIYLDGMQLKGRGEEMAEAVMRKEILK